jgi:hypothetical protein
MRTAAKLRKIAARDWRFCENDRCTHANQDDVKEIWAVSDDYTVEDDLGEHRKKELEEGDNAGQQQRLQKDRSVASEQRCESTES